MVVDKKEGIRLAKCLMDLLKDDTVFGDADKKHMNLDQTIEADATPLQENKPYCPSSVITLIFSVAFRS